MLPTLAAVPKFEPKASSEVRRSKTETDFCRSNRDHLKLDERSCAPARVSIGTAKYRSVGPKPPRRDAFDTRLLARNG